MKTILLLLVLSLVANHLTAKTAGNYVVVGTDTYYCDKVLPGMGHTKIINGGKTTFKIPSSEITAYCQEGKLFERLPVVTGQLDTAGWAFMQFIASRGELRLYRYCSNCTHFDPVTGIIAPALPVYRYYIYQYGKFHSIVEDQNVKNKLAEFGVHQLS